MSTSDDSGIGGQTTSDGDRKYELKVVKVVRGTEAKTQAKWQNEGWDLLSLDQGRLRTEMTFRRPKPKTFGTFLTQGYTAFRGLAPKAQKTLLAGSGTVVLILAIVIGVAVATQGGDEAPVQDSAPPTAAGTPASNEAPGQETAEKPTEDAVEPSSEDATEEDPVEPETAGPEQTESELAEQPAYAGPPYTTLWVDQDVVLGQADQHWVLVEGLDPEAGDFRDQVKMIISDIAQAQGTDKLSVSVVADEEIASYQSDLVGPDFVDERGQDYVDDVVLPKAKMGYLAWYRGGVDPNSTGALSDSDVAFEILWLPSGTAELETWRP